MTAHAHPRRPIRIVIVAILLAALLAFDLAARGLVWQAFWSLTGEENPVAQVRGVVEWAGQWLRPRPRTEPLAVISHADEIPYGINTFLEQEVEPEKRARQLQMIADAGFGWIRQEFPWEDIEIHGRGDFIDRRNDVDQDGQIDAIDAWAKYDNIVDLAEQAGVRIQARLSNPPAWAQASAEIGDFAPPADFRDFVNYAVAVAERYRGRIHHYQVWNEPNIYPEWGEQAVDPEGYTRLLCQTYTALKRVDPEIVVISGALAPTVSLTGRDLNDFIFLQRMYEAGAGQCFDILSMQGYGLYSGPTDRRMRPTTVNFSRNLYIRDLMVANGDADKAIWISEAAWSPVGEPGVPPDIIGFGNYGRVTLEQAARYMPIAYQRARREWPWIGVINYWFFKRASDAERNQAMYYFRMVEPDFTPLPVYDAMRSLMTNEPPVLYQGVHQENNWAIHYPDGADVSRAADAELGRFALTRELTFAAHGTDVTLRWRGPDVSPALEIDGQSVADWTERAVSEPEGDWMRVSLARSVLPQTHTFRIAADRDFQLDSVTVADHTLRNLLPFAAVAALALLIVLAVPRLRRARRG